MYDILPTTYSKKGSSPTIFILYTHGSGSKPCTPGEHKNSW